MPCLPSQVKHKKYTWLAEFVKDTNLHVKVMRGENCARITEW